MKRSDILPILETLFANPPFTIGQTYVVCWHRDKLALLASTCPQIPEIIFGVILKQDLKTGLTPEHWARLEAKIAKFLTQKGVLN